MTEQEYIDVGDRQSLIVMLDILRGVDSGDRTNLMRIRSIKESIKLMVYDIDERVKLAEA